MNLSQAASESSPAVVSDYDRLVASLINLDAAEGIRLLKQFIQTYPSFALGHNDLAVLYLRSGSSTLALAHHEKACRLQPDNVTFRKNLADFYAVELGWLDDAVDIYLDILKRNPRDTEALVALGRLGSAMEGTLSLTSPSTGDGMPTQPILLQTHQASEAAPADGECPLSGTFDDLYGNALECAAAGNFAAARAVLEGLIRRYPDNAVLHNDLGVVCYNLGDVTAAQINYERATALAPADTVCAANLADLYFTELGRGDDAVRIYLDLHSANPRDVDVLISLGHICSAVGRPAEANNFYRKALELEPLNDIARQGAAASLAETSRHQAVVPPRTAEEMHAEANRYAADDRLHEAHSLLEELVHQFPEDAIALNDLGVVRHRLGDLTGAVQAYEQAVALHSSNEVLRKNLADLYFVELGKTDEAISLYLDLFRQNPRDVETLTALGQISVAIGRRVEARTFFQQALNIDPWNKEVRAVLSSL